jgi:hypothetical protein
MSYRSLTVSLIIASAVLVTQSIAQTSPPGSGIAAGAATAKSGKSNTGDRMGGGGGGKGAAGVTTVKSSKSNSSDRMGGGGGGKGAAGVTTVKSSKSNSSDRMGGGGGGKGAGQLNPQPEPPGRR